ncbi:hypothetical protein [Janthinobacterium sp. J1-1]|uniref:hypothetical protein n=1 Tax=Janthinobacterium sp. J1-1 TaxID=3065910 RepID=UPI00281126AD|nr:hypothetical protein [Janthinobacterium sp. J1-1]
MTISIPSWLPRFLKITLPLAIGLAFILSAGPQVQSYLFSFVNSNVPSVYGSAYKDQLIDFPSLREWAVGVANWPFLAMAFIIVLTAIRDAKPRVILWCVSFSSFIVLSIFDIGFTLYRGDCTVKLIAENLLGNFVGSLVIAGLVVVIIALAEFLFLHVPANPVAKKIAAGSSVVISGFMFLVLMYYLADLFYSPLSVRMEAHLASPVSGAIVFKGQSNPSAKNNDVKLKKLSQSLVPNKAIHSHASWHAAEGQQKIAFRGMSPSTRYEVAFIFLSGLCTSEKIKKLSPVEPTMKFNDIDKGNISFDAGTSMLDIFTPESAASKFSLSIKDLSMFWFAQESSTKETHLTHFLNESDSVKIVVAHKDNSFLLTAPLMQTKAGKTVLATRIFTAKLGAKDYVIRFAPSKMARSDSVSNCKVVAAADIERSDNGGFLSAKGVRAVSNVLVKITQDEDPQTLSSEETEFLVSGGGGWFRLDPMNAEEFENHHVGALEMVQTRGNISELALDGQAMAARPLSTYTAVGEFTAAYGAGGALMVSGLAKSLWKDDGRLNMTKWEKLTWEPMVLILGLLGGAIVWVCARLTKCLRVNSPFHWLS